MSEFIKEIVFFNRNSIFFFFLKKKKKKIIVIINKHLNLKLQNFMNTFLTNSHHVSYKEKLKQSLLLKESYVKREKQIFEFDLKQVLKNGRVSKTKRNA